MTRRDLLPTIELVSHIPCKEHPIGRYVRDKKLIELSSKELRKYDHVSREFAIYHEIGHWLRLDYVPASDPTFQILYGTKGSQDEMDEYFADDFARYILSFSFGEPNLPCKDEKQRMLFFDDIFAYRTPDLYLHEIRLAVDAILERLEGVFNERSSSRKKRRG